MGVFGYIVDLIVKYGVLGIVDGILVKYWLVVFVLILVEEEYIGVLLFLLNCKNFLLIFDVEVYVVDLVVLVKVVIVFKVKLKLIMMDVFSLVSK